MQTRLLGISWTPLLEYCHCDSQIYKIMFCWSNHGVCKPTFKTLQKTTQHVWILATITPINSSTYGSVPSAAWEQVANIPANDPVAKGLHAFHTGLSAMAMAAILLGGSRTCRRRALEHIWPWAKWGPAQNTSICFQVQRWISIRFALDDEKKHHQLI